VKEEANPVTEVGEEGEEEAFGPHKGEL